MSDLCIPLDVETIGAWKNAEIILEYNDRELEIARCVAQYAANGYNFPVVLQTLARKLRELLKDADDFANSKAAQRPPSPQGKSLEEMIEGVKSGSEEALFILPKIISDPHGKEAQFLGLEYNSCRNELQKRVGIISAEIVAKLTGQAILCPLSVIDLKLAITIPKKPPKWQGE